MTKDQRNVGIQTGWRRHASRITHHGAAWYVMRDLLLSSLGFVLKMKSLLTFFRALAAPWTWRTAWRDSRRGRRRLFVFSTSITLGIAALTAIASFGRQLEDAVEVQAKTLLGADLVISSREPFNDAQDLFLESIGSGQAREARFNSMILFPKNEGTRLVQIRALLGHFPFYGRLETSPASAAEDFRDGQGVLVEESLMSQFNLGAGDSVKIGGLTLPILGSLRKIPGESVVFSTLAPRVYMAMSDLDKTQLLGPSSLARYRVYFQLEPDRDRAGLIRQIGNVADGFRWEYETVEQRKADLGRAMENLYHFLNLVGFVAVLLGGIGIASAMHVHVKQKLGTVAVLRCLGSASGQALAIYVAQGMALGLFGAFIGAILGVFVQALLPRVVADFLPMQVEFTFYWDAVLRGMGIGFGVCLLFSLLPLLPVRRVSPLAALRIGYADERRRDPIVWLFYIIIGVGLIAFSISQSRRWTFGLGFALGIVAAFGVLAGLAKGLAAMLRGRVPKSLPFVWRQGLANIHRPQNRTVLLVLSLGLGTFLILTLYLSQRTLIDQLVPGENRERANAVLFDIQPDQRDGVRGLLATHGVPVLQEAPIVTMRLRSIKGRALEEIRKDSTNRVPKWALDREYRSTFRDQLVDSEQLTAGQWHTRVEGPDAPIPVSVEAGIAKNLGVGLGDELVFDVQGVLLKTKVASLREVDWRRLQPNFFVVFPRGALEEAPAFHVFVTRVESSEQSARMQREVVKQYPNVSTIDLTLVLQTVDSVVGKISFVIRFMALFTVGTGLLVLVGTVLTGRFQRIQESILLRTLGASRGQILKILMVEYFALGTLAALTGVILAMAGSWALAHFVFKVNFTILLAPMVFAILLVSFLTVLTGMLMSRGICSHPPLEILRAES